MRRPIIAGVVWLAACGGGGGTPDAARLIDDDVPDATPPPTDHTFVIDRVLLPTKPGDPAKYGLDLDGDTLHDNAVGTVLVALAAAAGSGVLGAQQTIDDAVRQGAFITLLNVHASALAGATGVDVTDYVGANPVPMPCLDPANPTTATCGQHLKGTATFTVDASSPTDETITGAITAARFTGGPGTLLLTVTLLDGAPFTLHLVGARADLGPLGADGIPESTTPAVIGGAITQAEVDTVFLPGLTAGMSAGVTRDCPGGQPPGCGCASGSRGATWLALFDKSPQDCAITVDEVKNSDLIRTLLAPDVIVGGQPCLSIGVGVTAVPATFAVP